MPCTYRLRFVPSLRFETTASSEILREYIGLHLSCLYQIISRVVKAKLPIGLCQQPGQSPTVLAAGPGIRHLCAAKSVKFNTESKINRRDRRPGTGRGDPGHRAAKILSEDEIDINAVMPEVVDKNGEERRKQMGRMGK